MNAEITFFEKSVTYDKFVTDIAARLASFMKEDKDDPEYISQRRAERIYGQANVLRWRRSGAIKPIIRPGKIEYPTAQLKELSRVDEIFIRWQLSKKEKINQPSEFSDIRSFSSDRSEQITHNDKVAGSSPAGSTDIDVL